MGNMESFPPQSKYGAPMPDNQKPPTFDPLLGFDDRKPKDPPLTTAVEMENARVPLEFRDYCVDNYIRWVKCKRDYFPTTWKCAEAQHNWNHCIYEEKMDRYREYERERRLLERKAKKEVMAARALEREAQEEASAAA